MIEKDIHEKIISLFESGYSDRKISMKLSIDRSTVKKYKNISSDNTPKTFSSIIDIDDNVKKFYAYILGLYLGDGDISKYARTYRLRLYFHSINDRDVIERAVYSLSKLFPKNKISTYDQLHAKCTVVSVYNSAIPELFPQHGSGKKHSRCVSLTNSQINILDKKCSKFLLAGLHDSDGSFYLEANRERFMFANTSIDIINLYKELLELYNIHYTISATNKEWPSRNLNRIFTRTKSGVDSYKKLLDHCYTILS